MTESVAEIKQRPLAVFALVAGDYSCFATAGNRDGMFARGSAGKDVTPIGVEPVKKGRVAEKAIFDEFGIAGAEFARWQRVERRGVGEHEDRLMKSTDQVLAMGGIDCRFAADRGVHLCQ